MPKGKVQRQVHENLEAEFQKHPGKWFSCNNDTGEVYAIGDSAKEVFDATPEGVTPLLFKVPTGNEVHFHYYYASVV